MVIQLLTLLLATTSIISCQYLPTWESIDSRPLPRWYDESKLGIFIHWGVFSVPSFGDEWFWYYWKTNHTAYTKFMKDQYPPSFTYQDFAKDFDAYMFDPVWWADLIEDAGAKYVVLTSKHHEGFTLWPSNVSFSWNANDVGPNRDLLGELAATVRDKKDIRFGVYHSMFEWFNPLHVQDAENKWKTRRFPDFKTIPEMYELVNTYKPDLFWSDGDEGKPYTYWNSTQFLAWLYNESPVKDTVVVNDRWGDGCICKHGGYWTCDDRYNPGVVVNHKWENCFTVDKVSWGYRRDAVLADYLTDGEVLSALVSTVSCGGNLLLNIGPRKDGRIDPIMEERLRQLGRWLRVNGDAIYKTSPWLHQNETNSSVWYTAKQDGESFYVYAIFLAWPANDELTLQFIMPTGSLKISMLGLDTGNLSWKPAVNNNGVTIDLSSIGFGDMPSLVGWALKIENIASEFQRFHSVVVNNYHFQ